MTNTNNQKPFIDDIKAKNNSELNWDKALNLIKTKITGHRKGLPNNPSYEHSIRVSKIIRDIENVTSDIILAALLHDIIEDSGVNLEELKALGFSDETIKLVDLCSHDLNIKDSNQRWVSMVARLIKTGNSNAWLIKLADIYDNLQESYALSPKRRRFITEAKAPLLLELTKTKLGDTNIWINLNTLYEKLRKDIQLDPYWTQEAPYEVRVQDTFYADGDSSGSYTIAKYNDYISAVNHARERTALDKDEVTTMYGEDIYIVPEPSGLHFRSNDYRK